MEGLDGLLGSRAFDVQFDPVPTSEESLQSASAHAWHVDAWRPALGGWASEAVMAEGSSGIPVLSAWKRRWGERQLRMPWQRDATVPAWFGLP